MRAFFDVHHHFLDRDNGIYNLGIKEDIPDGYFSVGIHPKDILPNFEDDLNKVKEKSKHKNCLAVGECGLDALVNVEETLQEKVFLEQILWANEINKPLIIHCVRRFLPLLKFRKEAKVPLIIHGFNKKKRLAEELIANGFYLSFGKSLLCNIGLRDTIKDMPLEKMFVETDVWEGSIGEIYSQLALVKDMQIDTLNKRLMENIKGVFGIED